MGDTLRKKTETFVGPCSKFVSGQGWTTEIPVEEIKKKGWIKLDENAVVLTREEYDGKSIIVEMSGGHKLKLSVGKFGKMSKILEEHTRKETAEKFAERLKTECFDGGIDDKWVAVSFSRLDEICKEITEGLK